MDIVGRGDTDSDTVLIQVRNSSNFSGESGGLSSQRVVIVHRISTGELYRGGNRNHCSGKISFKYSRRIHCEGYSLCPDIISVVRTG